MFSGGAKSIVMQIYIVILLFSDQISGRGKSFQGGQTASGGRPPVGERPPAPPVGERQVHITYILTVNYLCMKYNFNLNTYGLQKSDDIHMLK